ncbi:MAG: O-antigen ligase family protein [Candidatus Ryanbacteria bacterium]|nr:O-antigen ligase family protein [Candidatus Ryanbacteria bacterium]
MSSNRAFIVLVSAAVFLTPLLTWDGLLFASTSTKTFFFATVVEIMFALWLPKALVLYKTRARGVVSFFVILFFAAAFLASLFDANFYHSYWSNYERMMGLWTLGHIVIFFFIAATTLTRREDWLWPMRAAASGAFISAVYAVFEFIESGGAARVESTLRNASFLASYLLVASFLCLWLGLRHGAKRPESTLWLLCFVVVAVALVLTGSRGAMIALAVGVALLISLFLAFAKSGDKTLGVLNARLKKYAVPVFIILLFAVVVGFIFKEQLAESSFDPLSRLASISLSESTAEGRLLAWQVSWRGWKERFLFGWGVENYNLLFNKYYDARLVDQEPWFDRAHNLFLDVGSTTGIFGLLAYLGMFGAGTYALWRGFKENALSFWEYAIFSVALFAYLLHGMFTFDFLISLMLIFFILAFAHAHALSLDAKPRRAPHPRTEYYAVAFAAVAFIWFFGLWWPLRENYLARKGYDAFAAGRDEEAIALYERALSYDTYGNIDVRRSAAEYLTKFLKQGGRRDATSLKRVMDYTIEKMEQNILEAPYDVKWYMYQGEALNLGAVMLAEPNREHAQRAEARFLEAAKLSPARVQIYLELAQARKVQGNYKEMWEALERARSLNPDYAIVRYNMLVQAIETKERAREAEELAGLLARRPDIDFVLIRDAYYRSGRFADAVSIQRMYIEDKTAGLSNEALAPFYQSLAALYKAAGDILHAREAALKVAELNPALKAEVEAFLQTLK